MLTNDTSFGCCRYMLKSWATAAWNTHASTEDGEGGSATDGLVASVTSGDGHAVGDNDTSAAFERFDEGVRRVISSWDVAKGVSLEPETDPEPVVKPKSAARSSKMGRKSEFNRAHGAAVSAAPLSASKDHHHQQQQPLELPDGGMMTSEATPIQTVELVRTVLE